MPDDSVDRDLVRLLATDPDTLGEELLAQIRSTANVRPRTTVVLSTARARPPSSEGGPAVLG